MAQFIALTTGDIPELGSTGAARVYRGDHLTELDAANAAVEALDLETGQRLWLIAAGSLTRYVATMIKQGTAVVG